MIKGEESTEPDYESVAPVTPAEASAAVPDTEALEVEAVGNEATEAETDDTQVYVDVNMLASKGESEDSVTASESEDDEGQIVTEASEQGSAEEKAMAASDTDEAEGEPSGGQSDTGDERSAMDMELLALSEEAELLRAELAEMRAIGAGQGAVASVDSESELSAGSDGSDAEEAGEALGSDLQSMLQSSSGGESAASGDDEDDAVQLQPTAGSVDLRGYDSADEQVRTGTVDAIGCLSLQSVWQPPTFQWKFHENWIKG